MSETKNVQECEYFSKKEENTFIRKVLKWKSREDIPSEGIISLFNRLNIFPGDGKSYFIKGSKSQLKDFENYYRLLATFNRTLSFRSPCRAQIYRYANKLTYGDEEGRSWFGTDEDLLILTEGERSGGREGTNTEEWLKTTIVKHVENRKNCNQVTLILSERDIPLIRQECGTTNQPKDACLMAFISLAEHLGHATSGRISTTSTSTRVYKNSLSNYD